MVIAPQPLSSVRTVAISMRILRLLAGYTAGLSPQKRKPAVPMDEQQIDSAAYRRALSCFATGVTVVTTLDGDGQRVGITVSSFNSVSLDPPLVLWSIGKDSLSYDAFIKADSFVVNVLSSGQSDLSNRFAAKRTDKFNGLDCRSGIAGIPILPDCAASFECTTEHLYEGGDHTIIVGRVAKFADSAVDPLIIFRSDYLRASDE